MAHAMYCPHTKDHQVALAFGLAQLILHQQGVLSAVLGCAGRDGEGADSISAALPVARAV